MSDHQDITRALERLVEVPDRRDWSDVRRRSATARPLSPKARALLPRLRRRAVAIGGVVGVAALGSVLAVLLISAPDPDGQPPDPVGAALQPVADADVPPTIREALPGALPNTTAIVFSQFVNGREVRAWRAIDTRGQYLSAIERVGSPAERIGGEPFEPNCIFPSSVVPADPPGSPRRVIVPEIFGLGVDDGVARLRAVGFGDIRRPESGRELLATDPLPGRSAFVSAEIRLTALESVAGVRPYRDPVGDVTEPVVCGALWTGRPDQSNPIVYGEAPPTAAHVELVVGGNVAVREDVQNGFFAFEHDLCRSAVESIVARDAAGVDLGRIAPSETAFGDAFTPKVYCVTPRAAAWLGDDVSALSDPSLDRRTDLLAVDDVPEPIDSANGRVVATVRQPGLVYGDIALVLAPTQDNGELCIVFQSTRGDAGWECWERGAVTEGRAALWFQQSRQGDPVVVVGVVPDGVRAVDLPSPEGLSSQRANVQNNVWFAVLASPLDAVEATLIGTGGADLGAVVITPIGVTRLR